jgi:hypothetical protein
MPSLELMQIEFLHGLCEMVQSGLDRSETADIGPKLSGPKTRPPVQSSAFMRPQTRPTTDQTKDRSGDRSQTGPLDLYLDPALVLRSVHLIPAFAHPEPAMGTLPLPSIARPEAQSGKEWSWYYVGM